MTERSDKEAEAAARDMAAALERAANGIPYMAEGVITDSTLSAAGWVVTVSCPDVGEMSVPQSTWCGAFSTAVAARVAALPAGQARSGLLNKWRVLMGFPAGRPHILDVVGVN